VRVLLDTNILLWAIIEPSRLKPGTRPVLQDPENEILFSAASVWEVAIKAALGRADFRVSPEEIFEEAIANGFVELPVRSAAALRVAGLPLHHRDPFDRLLIAQAMTEPARFYTADAALKIYSDLVTRV
jgi:PIN domain nuclease of toxin-antitoxin system